MVDFLDRIRAVHRNTGHFEGLRVDYGGMTAAVFDHDWVVGDYLIDVPAVQSRSYNARHAFDYHFIPDYDQRLRSPPLGVKKAKRVSTRFTRFAFFTICTRYSLTRNAVMG